MTKYLPVLLINSALVIKSIYALSRIRGALIRDILAVRQGRGYASSGQEAGHNRAQVGLEGSS